MLKGFKIRIYPTKEQESLIFKHIGACRYIWNYMLDLQIKQYDENKKFLTGFDMIKLLPALKQKDDYKWLKEISNTSLQRTCLSLAEAYHRFFSKQCNFPNFKSRKKSKLSFPVRSENIYFDDKKVNVEKIGKIKYKTDYVFKLFCKNYVKNACISYVNGKFMLSFSMECENQTLQLTNKPMGIDLGIKELAVVAYDDKQIIFHNINKSKKIRNLYRKLKHTQRTVSRKYDASKKRTGRYEKTKNIEREEEKVRKIYAKISNIRLNYLHQTTSKLISMLPNRIVMEDLNIQGLMKNRHVSKAISEQYFSKFIHQIKYKCEWNGIEFVQADRFYPSSKICSCYYNVKQNLKLADRTYVCDKCGLSIDRDYNAAINLMRYADL